jgi:membrane protease YdiL (CAAX protease family)
MASSGDDGERSRWPGSTEGTSRRFEQLRPLSPPPSEGSPPTGVPGPADRADGGWWVVFAAIGFVVGQIAALIIVDIAAQVSGNGAHLTEIASLAAPPAWYIASGLVGLWVGFFFGPFLASRVRGTRRFARDLGISFRPIDVVGVAVGLGGQLLVTLLYLPFVSHLKNFEAPTTKLTGGAHGGAFVLIALLTVLGAPFFEELFFRGLLFRGLLGLLGGNQRAGARLVVLGLAVVLDGLLFGLAHAEFEQLAGLALFGCILAVVVYRTQRLGMSMVAHATFNLVAVIAIASNRAVIVH